MGLISLQLFVTPYSRVWHTCTAGKLQNKQQSQRYWVLLTLFLPLLKTDCLRLYLLVRCFCCYVTVKPVSQAKKREKALPSKLQTLCQLNASKWQSEQIFRVKTVSASKNYFGQWGAGVPGKSTDNFVSIITANHDIRQCKACLTTCYCQVYSVLIALTLWAWT